MNSCIAVSVLVLAAATGQAAPKATAGAAMATHPGTARQVSTRADEPWRSVMIGTEVGSSSEGMHHNEPNGLEPPPLPLDPVVLAPAEALQPVPVDVPRGGVLQPLRVTQKLRPIEPNAPEKVFRPAAPREEAQQAATPSRPATQGIAEIPATMAEPPPINHKRPIYRRDFMIIEVVLGAGAAGLSDASQADATPAIEPDRSAPAEEGDAEPPRTMNKPPSYRYRYPPEAEEASHAVDPSSWSVAGPPHDGTT